MVHESDTRARRVLVTGASRGIGRAVALQLARDGFDIAVNYLRSKAAAEELVGEIRKLGRDVVAEALHKRLQFWLWLIRLHPTVQLCLRLRASSRRNALTCELPKYQ